jgi:hypothetical protein
VTEAPTGRQDLSGFGENVVKLNDPDTGETIAFVGVQQGEERIHFPKPITADQVEAVSELLQRKKFTKHISNERFDKAQAYADRKFS